MNTASTSRRKIRIMIVEDHVLVRMGLVAAATDEPDIEVVAEADDGRQVIDTYRANPADVVILDLKVPGMSGTDMIKALKAEFKSVRILVLSSYGSGDDIGLAMKAGASGYVVKGMPLNLLMEGIRIVHNGGRYLPDEISKRIKGWKFSDLSSREVEVLKCVVHGKSNKEIASEMGIAEGTVKTHLIRIYEKLGASDRAHAMAIAIKLQLIEL